MNTKNLALDLIRVTEAAALAAAQYVGRGDKLAADGAATDAMRSRLNKIDFSGMVVLGEGIKDNAPGLFCGDQVGLHQGMDPQFDIAVDPIEGTTPTSKGGYEACSVIAVGNRGSLFSSECFYMRKLALGPSLSNCNISIHEPLEEIINKCCFVLGRPPAQLTVCMLDRPRHESDIILLRRLGCRIRLISDCDVSGAIASCVPDSGIDLYYGVGGTPEGVISAAALKCMRGQFQGMLVGSDGKLLDTKVYTMEDLASGDVIFCATGITDGSLLRGVRFTHGRPYTHSVLMRSESRTVRWIQAQHGN